MGTRLYPKTKNPEILEALAGVAPGTYAEVQAINKEEAAEQNDIREAMLAAQTCGADPTYLEADFHTIGYKYYERMTSCPHRARLSHFLIFGWGSISTRAASVIASFSDINFGETKGFFQDLTAQMILAAQNITLPPGVRTKDLEGLCWN